MDYSIETQPVDKLQSDCTVVGVYEKQQLTASAQTLDLLTDGLISKVLARGDIAGKIGETLLLTVHPATTIERILLVGLGEKKSLTNKDFFKSLTAAFTNLKKPGIKTLVCALADVDVDSYDWTWKTRQIVTVCSDVNYQYTETKSDKTTESQLTSVHISVAENQHLTACLGLTQGMAIAEGMLLTKHVADLPANLCTPSYLAQQALAMGEQYDSLVVSVLEEADMAELGMGAFLSVSRGSRQPAKLITLNYQAGDKNTKPIVLIGKGLTFDAGGISLKPAAGMDEMKYDMCGGATVLGTLLAAAKMALPLNIIGLIPASENLPDGEANRPGDIVTSMAGKTIEILNTDAEGRLLLCDALTYAERFQPEVVIDMATLTGACLVALGRIPSGLLGNDDELCNELLAAGNTANDSLWRLPLWEEYQELLKSNFADLANIGGRDAGTITAACFLARFAENFRWAHLDIAGTAWRSGIAKGATGRPVPLLAHYLIQRAAASI